MAARSISIVLVNNTENELHLDQQTLLHGIWRSPPPSLIQPNSQAAWSTESDGAGVEGWVTYHLVFPIGDVAGIPEPDAEHLSLRWDNPAVGSNSYAQAVGKAGYEVLTQGGQGDAAAVTFTLRHVSQGNWRWCKNCQCLAFPGSGPGRCVNGAPHDYSGSGNYTITYGTADSPGQADWIRCKKCQSMVYNSNPRGNCFAGDRHDYEEGTSIYALQNNIALVAGQDNWRWCNKCQCLAFAGNATLGPCPAGGLHDHQGSGDYTLELS